MGLGSAFRQGLAGLGSAFRQGLAEQRKSSAQFRGMDAFFTGNALTRCGSFTQGF
jgi:hypothetical protein